jgi:hypothetical protein
MARISEAYSFLLHQYSDNALSKEKQESILKSIDKAYTTLSDPFKRIEYDNWLEQQRIYTGDHEIWDDLTAHNKEPYMYVPVETSQKQTASNNTGHSLRLDNIKDKIQKINANLKPQEYTPLKRKAVLIATLEWTFLLLAISGEYWMHIVEKSTYRNDLYDSIIVLIITIVLVSYILIIVFTRGAIKNFMFFGHPVGIRQNLATLLLVIPFINIMVIVFLYYKISSASYELTDIKSNHIIFIIWCISLLASILFIPVSIFSFLFLCAMINKIAWLQEEYYEQM